MHARVLLEQVHRELEGSYKYFKVGCPLAKSFVFSFTISPFSNVLLSLMSLVGIVVFITFVSGGKYLTKCKLISGQRCSVTKCDTQTHKFFIAKLG